MERFEKFQMTDTGYILVSKKTRKIHAISFSNGDIRMVSKRDSEAQLLINGMFLNGAEHYESEFIKMMDAISVSKDPLAFNAIYALSHCYCSPSIQKAIKVYLS